MTTLREAVANLIKVKGRHNTEIAYQKLIEAFDADKPVFCGCGDQIMPDDGAECGTCVTARNAVKQEPLAQPEQEPVFAFRRKGLDDFCTCSEDRYNELAQKPSLFEVKKFYTAPPQREWQGLTDEEIKQLWKDTPQLVGVYSYTDIAREVEAKLKEKNT